MTFAREKRVLLGFAAIGVALPLPLNDALDWGGLALFVVAVALFLRRAAQGREGWLSRRSLNVLGLAYLPVLLVDVGASWPGQPVRPVLHLILFALAAKLWSLERERDKWQAWVGIFFVFLASMATSTHPSVIAYLVAYLAISVVLLLRFVHLHLLSSFSAQRGAAPALGASRATAVIVLATVAVAAPLFALLPRVRSPFVVGPVGVGQDTGTRVGFSDEMSLDQIGRIRDNRAIVLRMQLSGRYPNPGSLRIRAGSYERWVGRAWIPAPGRRRLVRSNQTGAFEIVPGAAIGSARIELEPLRSVALPVPVETVAVEIRRPSLDVSNGGALGLGGMPPGRLDYVAQLGTRPVSSAPAPDDAARGETLSLQGVTPAIAELAARWGGTGPDAERAERIQRHLLGEYEYTLDTVGRGGDSPLEDFLLRTRRGHCEYFASAMVLLLRAQGIPARLATGFYGAEWSVWEKGWIVRQSNAHAWVEAWLPDRGWTVFDPTPPDGRPSADPEGVWSSIRQAWDAIQLRWDRWVISYDFEDQLGALGDLRGWWSRLWSRLRATPGGRPETTDPSAGPVPSAPEPEEAPRGPGGRLVWFLAALLLALATSALLLRARAGASTRQAYLSLRSALRGAGWTIADSMAPLALARMVEAKLPEAAPSSNRIIACYVRDAFGGRGASPEELARLGPALVEVSRSLQASRRRRRSRSV